MTAPIRHSSFSVIDVSRAIKGVKRGGERVGRVELSADGKIVIYCAGGEPVPLSVMDDTDAIVRTRLGAD